MLTKKQIKTIRPGQWIRIIWDDTGIQDVIALESGKIIIADKVRYMSVLEPNCERHTIDLEQIVQISPDLIIQPPKY